MSDFDIVIAGGSIAGCTAATLFGRRGLKVALLERRPDVDAYKVVCSHYIQANVTPMLRRHGFAEAIEAQGGVRNHLDVWTPWGWIRPRGDIEYGYTLRRSRLDPLLRRAAAETPGVELMLGHTVRDLTWRDGRVTGVQATTRDGRRQTIRARLVVAADGGDSGVARMARVPGRVLPNNRFAYFAYVRGLPPHPDGAAQAWLLNPDFAFVSPCDDGLSCVVASPIRSRLPAFKRDLESEWLRFVEKLPDGPPIRAAERVSPLVGRVAMRNLQRPAARHGVAFVGDAALTGDPRAAIGCGWAFLSSEWLVDATAGLLSDRRDVDPGLRRYRWRHRSRLMPFHLAEAHASVGRPLNPAERLVLTAAVHDEILARHLHEYLTGSRPVHRFIWPPTYARAIGVLGAAGAPRSLATRV